MGTPLALMTLARSTEELLTVALGFGCVPTSISKAKPRQLCQRKFL